MSAREILAYAITHAPKGVKGGPYEGGIAIGAQVPTLREATRWPGGRPPMPQTLRAVRKVHPTARVIRIVRARPSRLEASATLETARRRLASVAEHMTEHAYQEMASALEVDACRVGPSEASAVEVLRDIVAILEKYPLEDTPRALDKARRVLAASGPDAMPVVRAALRETEAWDAYLAAPATRSRAETEVLDNASRKRFAAVDAYRKAGGK